MTGNSDDEARQPGAAMMKLLEIANGLEADHAGRMSVGAINHAFLYETETVSAGN